MYLPIPDGLEGVGALPKGWLDVATEYPNRDSAAASPAILEVHVPLLCGRSWSSVTEPNSAGKAGGSLLVGTSAGAYELPTARRLDGARVGTLTLV